MSQLQTDRVWPSDLRELDDLVAQSGRTRADVASDLLTEQRGRSPAEFVEALRAIRDMTPTDVKQTDSVEMIRALRDE